MTKKKRFIYQKHSCSSIEEALENQREREKQRQSNQDANQNNDNTNNNRIGIYQYDYITDRYYKSTNNNSKKIKKNDNNNNNNNNNNTRNHYEYMNSIASFQLYPTSSISKRLEYIKLLNINYHLNVNDNNVNHRVINDSHHNDEHGILIIRDHNDGLQIHLNQMQKLTLLRNKNECEISTEKYKNIDNFAWKPYNHCDDNKMLVCFTNDHSYAHHGIIIAQLFENESKRNKVFIKDLHKIRNDGQQVQQLIWSHQLGNNDVIYVMEESRIKMNSLSNNNGRYLNLPNNYKKSSFKYVQTSCPNTLICGLRNGKVISYDLRENDNYSNYIDLCSMKYSVDYTYSLRNNNIIVQDIVGNIKVFDKRKPNNELVTIRKPINENIVARRQNTIWVSENEHILVTTFENKIQLFDLNYDQTLLVSKPISEEDYYTNISISSQTPNHIDRVNYSYESGLNGVIHSNNYNYQDQIWIV